MFSFFHSKSTIIIDCFTDNYFAYNYAPIKKASRCLPEWFKKLPNNKRKWKDFHPDENRNIRNCYGFVELFKRGLIIENHCDSHLTVDNHGIKYNISTSCVRPPIVHPQHLYKGGFENYYHLKIQLPWMFVEKKGIQFLYTSPTWLLENYYFDILPGVVEFKVNRTTAANIMFAKPPIGQSYETFIPAGQPLAHLIPLSEDKNIEIKTHLISNEEYIRMNDQGTSIALFGGYNSLARLNKKNEEQSKCPFH